MGICPNCGSWIDEGEPYCPECGYGLGGSGYESSASGDTIVINGYEYERSDVEEALDELGYDWEDFNLGIVDEYELEEVLDDL